MTPDFETVASGSPDGIVKVSVVTSFALIVLFCATNVVLRGSMLRRVELIARGRITQVMPAPRSFSGSEAHGEGDAPDALQDAYRRIAFDRGLTPRELDVLVVLGRGNTLARVQSELVISEGTAITCTASRSFSTSSSATRAHESGEGRSPPTGAASYG